MSERSERRRKAAEILAKLPPQVREQIKANPQILKVEVANRKKYYPSKDFIPNIAQTRAVECYRVKHPEYGDYAKEMIFRAGNGVGKTCVMAIFIAGLTLGPDFINKEFLNLGIFYDFEEIRRQRPLQMRIVGDGADMEESGSAYQQIKKWIPFAQFSGKTSGSYYTKITIPAPYEGMHPTVIDFKTHDQKITAHAGPDYDFVLFNEPAPEAVYAENASRTRLGGYLASFLTPLNMASYLHTIENAQYEDGAFYVTEASIWDNCADIPGNRGMLTRRNIEDQIRRWMAINPLQVPARRDGKFMHLAGAVFQIYNQSIHQIDPLPIDPSWNIYMALDPHDSKPPFVIWIAVTPMNMAYVIAEYPTEPWDQINGTPYTIKQFCHEFRRIENGQFHAFPYIKRLRVAERYGDPNKMGDRQPNTGRTMKEEYEFNGGMDFINASSDDIQLRHDRIKDMLLYNPDQKVSPINTPHLFVFKSCKNVCRAFSTYAYSAKQGNSTGLSDKLDQTWICPISCVGYATLSYDPWMPNPMAADEGGSDYDEYLKGMEAGHESQREGAYAGERYV